MFGLGSTYGLRRPFSLGVGNGGGYGAYGSNNRGPTSVANPAPTSHPYVGGLMGSTDVMPPAPPPSPMSYGGANTNVTGTGTNWGMPPQIAPQVSPKLQLGIDGGSQMPNMNTNLTGLGNPGNPQFGQFFPSMSRNAKLLAGGDENNASGYGA